MAGTIADKYVTARGKSVPNMKHLIASKDVQFYLATGGGLGLAALCGRPVVWEDPVEPSRACSACVDTAHKELRRAASRTVTTNR